MKHHQFFRAFAVFAVVTLGCFSFVSSAGAIGTATVGTTLTFQPPTPVSVGSPAIVVLQMISSKGEPVANQSVELFVDGVHERRARTDADGNVTFKVRRDEAGTYALVARFKGSKAPSLGSSNATADLVVTPALIEVHVTPPLPNISFSLSNQIFSSDDYGVARVEVQKAGTYRLELLPLETNNPDIQMAFGRWADDYFVASRDIEIPLKKPLEVGLEVSYQVGQTFVDLQGKPVDLSRITSITLKGSNGATYTFEDNLSHWLPAGRVIRLNNGLEETKILYSVISVVIDGSNVVSQAQQRFYVHQNDVWPVKLLLYTARFTAYDALFRFPIGTGIRMEYPDGDVQTFKFSSHNDQTISGLARGIYRVTVIGAKGFAPPTPIALSRNQDVGLMVFSYLDMGVLGGIGVILALGLLFFGRPHLIRQTVTFPARAVARVRSFRPAILKGYSSRRMAIGSNPVSREADVRLEPQNDIASLESTAYVEPEVVRPAALVPEQSEDLIFADEPTASDEESNPMPEIVSETAVEQTDLANVPSQPETLLASPEAEPVTAENTQNELVAEAAEIPTPVDQASTAQAEGERICQICGSSQLVKKETKRPNQQRYQCQACGASNNFGPKRTRRHRQKNRVESFV